MAAKEKKKDSNTHPEEYTNENIRRDLQLIAKSINNNNQAITSLIASNEAMEKRLEEVENMVGDEDDSFGLKDKRKALSVLADRVINPGVDMLPQMTETPDRMILGIVIERTRNKFIQECAFNPDSDVLFSDIFIEQFNIVMRSRHRALIGEAMGFSQIEVEKQIEAEDRLESRGEG